jgi:uncharacterized protein YjiS (DUF1127 family)
MRMSSSFPRVVMPAGNTDLVGSALRAIAWFRRAAEVRRQRRALLGLSDAMLKDIGISRGDAAQEGARRFWDVPRMG